MVAGLTPLKWELRRAVAVAEPELLAASARTGMIGPLLEVLGGCQCHHIGRRAAVLQ